jgi:hypothetical protein
LAMREHITTAGERLLLKMLANNLTVPESVRRPRHTQVE